MARAMILLVSDQPMPNLLAALDPALDVAEVHLLVTRHMKDTRQAERVASIIEARGLRVVAHLVSDAFRPDVSRSLVGSIVKADPERFVLNLTGGTKPMVLGAYRAALDHGVRDLLYLDHEERKLRWLDGNRSPQRGSARLRAEEILRAHGYSPQREAAPPSRSAVLLAQSLHQQLDGDVLARWNKLFSEVERVCGKKREWTPKDITLSCVFGDGEAEAIRLLDRPLREAAAMGFCAWGRGEESGGRVRVDRQEDLQLLHGGWFELVVHQALEELASSHGLDELLLNLEVDSPDGGSNEFDCVALRENRLLFFEVKTAAMTGAYGAGKPRDVLYRLGILKGAGGLMGRACLVSRVAVPDSQAKRFAGAGLGLVHGEETGPERLAASLGAWIRAG